MIPEEPLKSGVIDLDDTLAYYTALVDLYLFRDHWIGGECTLRIAVVVISAALFEDSKSEHRRFLPHGVRTIMHVCALNIIYNFCCLFGGASALLFFLSS